LLISAGTISENGTGTPVAPQCDINTDQACRRRRWQARRWRPAISRTRRPVV